MARIFPILLVLSIACLLTLVLSLSVGSLAIPLENLPSLLFSSQLSEQSSLHYNVVVDLRLPRTLSAMLVGAELALAGCLMQVLLRNPLADPYVLGVSGGASVGALIAMLLGLAGWQVSGSALIGAITNMVLVFGLAHGRGSWSPTRLLLTGVVIASGWGAIISFLLSISQDTSLRGMLFWLMGDLSNTDLPGWDSLLAIICLLIAFAMARPLNLMVRGEMQARALGVSPYPLQICLYLLASLLTAMAVTRGGNIGFIGLVVPHILRQLIGSDHRLLLPASVLAGGLLLMLADTFARTGLAPQQLPVGVITAMIGVPLFLFVLQRRSRSGQL
ncbi:MAG: iron ABC transporter permease [Motiliproteus sp.]|nr:iron ABC transporter permease [Motiliproteus sp.]MCW9054268.1 iron ABC transporter permease [Motiliproteus sp.]